MGLIYGNYGGPLCKHYNRLSFIHYDRARKAGMSSVGVWAGSLPTGPHHGQDTKTICLSTTGMQQHWPEDDLSQWRILSADEFLRMELKSKDHSFRLRSHQADLAKEQGFCGPIKGGEARALSRFLRAIGKDDCVRRLWLWRKWEKVRWPGTAWERKWHGEHLTGPLYAFRPFLDGYSFDDFMRVFRMMRPGCKDARKAIREAMANPNMKEDLEMLSVFDTMSEMGGSK